MTTPNAKRPPARRGAGGRNRSGLMRSGIAFYGYAYGWAVSFLEVFSRFSRVRSPTV